MTGGELASRDLRLAGPAGPQPGAATRVVAGALVRCALRGEEAWAGPHLLVRAPGGPARAVALPPELTVGRGAGAGLVLDDPRASRLHLRIRLAEDGTALVEDLGSKNGLRLNARPLPPGPAPLRPGDELTVGETALRFVDPLEEAPGAAAGAVRSGAPAAAPSWPVLMACAGLLGVAAALLSL